MNTRELTVITNPKFYEYTTIEKLSQMNLVELTICLSLLRKEQRRLKEKVYVRGMYYRATAEEVDKESEQAATAYREELEQLFYDKQGFIPTRILAEQIEFLKKKHQQCNRKIEENQRKKTKPDKPILYDFPETDDQYIDD
ncbi:hypothetical protein [Enterococcus sp. LJL90]